MLHSDMFTVDIAEHANDEKHSLLNCQDRVVFLCPYLNRISASCQWFCRTPPHASTIFQYQTKLMTSASQKPSSIVMASELARKGKPILIYKQASRAWPILKTQYSLIKLDHVG